MSEVTRTSYHSAWVSPRILIKINQFLNDAEREALSKADDIFRNNLEFISSPEDLPSVLFPFRKVVCVEEAEDVFKQYQGDTSSLRMAGSDKRTDAFRALKKHDFELCNHLLDRGGALALNKRQTRYLCSLPYVHFEHPRLCARICQARWDAAKTPEQKQEELQELLEEACAKGNLKTLKLIIKRHAESGLTPLGLAPALEHVVMGGFDHLLPTLLSFISPDTLTPEQKEEYVQAAVQLGYAQFLLMLESFGFPVTPDQKEEMGELMALQETLESQISFPEPANTTHDEIHGGVTNKTISHAEYKRIVAWVVHELIKGTPFPVIFNGLHCRRLRMAVHGKLTELYHYGAPTDQIMETLHISEGTYGEWGDFIRKHYSLPLRVNVVIDGKQVPLTQIKKEKWVHPDGTHRDEVLAEIDRICEANFRKLNPDIATPLAKVIFLFSHSPPARRGTPIMMRAFVDGISIFQQRKLIPPNRELNLEALVFVNMGKFVEYFVKKTPLPIIATKTEDIP